MWSEWIGVLLGNANAPIESGSLPVPLLVRLPIAALVIVWAARGDRRWALPIGCLLALPVIWYGSLSLIVATIPLLRTPRLREWHWPPIVEMARGVVVEPWTRSRLDEGSPGPGRRSPDAVAADRLRGPAGPGVVEGAGEEVAELGDAAEDRADRPAVGAQVRVVELGPGDRRADRRAPSDGRTAYGATSVLIGAFWV